jgi:CRP/FNR family transcriptional regulator, cyclic AMP receptor protein
MTAPLPGPAVQADDPALDWFGHDVPPATRARLAELAQLQRFAPGEVVFREGGESLEFGVVRSGRIALRVVVPERGAVTILTVEPGDVINWSALVPPHRSTSTGTALSDVEILAFDAAAFRGALRSDDALAAAVYPRVLRAVSRRLMATRLQLLDLFARTEDRSW